jgi:Skp family chaperone for outer membrane proteins
MTKILGFFVLVLSLLVAVPVLAQSVSTTPPPAVSETVAQKIGCVSSAVATRESALYTAITAHMKDVEDAYTKRATELSGAYSNSTAKAVKAGEKVAWTDFSKSIQTASSKWKKSRRDIWTSFRASANACKAPAGVSDSGNSGLELNVQ